MRNFTSTFSFNLFKQNFTNYKKIAVLTGAGISVAAGIPDFRTPGTGLYDNLSKYNIPYPEAIFDINYYKNNPEPFHLLCMDYFIGNYQPTKAHFFIKYLDDINKLLINFTQNIDGYNYFVIFSLEYKTGINPNKLVEAHGNMRDASCIICGREAPISEFFEKIKEKMNCRCKVKPNIVFFGENLPLSFFVKRDLIAESDCIIVMGTSLQVLKYNFLSKKVFPFAGLLSFVNIKTPIVVINRDMPDIDLENPILFVQGDIEKNVIEIMKELKN